MAFLGSRPSGDSLLALYEEAGANAQRVCVLLRDLLRDFPEHAELAEEILRGEQEGDRITHDIIHSLSQDRAGRPFDFGDGHQLASALDDIVDDAEQAADQLVVYKVEAPMEQAVLLADVLVGAAEQVARALSALREQRDLSPHLVEIHRLENEGDRLVRDAVASLFAGGIDPMIVIRWKDIFETIESAIDACEKVAHALEGIALKRR
jgi:predicted phosphate transport protein (TIGR00153 family)